MLEISTKFESHSKIELSCFRNSGPVFSRTQETVQKNKILVSGFTNYRSRFMLDLQISLFVLFVFLVSIDILQFIVFNDSYNM